jgi:hypothetical protein
MYNDLEIERTEFLSNYYGEPSERELYSEPSAGTSQTPGRTPPYRYFTFPRQGEYMVPLKETYKLPTNREIESPGPEYVNLQKGVST